MMSFGHLSPVWIDVTACHTAEITATTASARHLPRTFWSKPCSHGWMFTLYHPICSNIFWSFTEPSAFFGPQLLSRQQFIYCDKYRSKLAWSYFFAIQSSPRSAAFPIDFKCLASIKLAQCVRNKQPTVVTVSAWPADTSPATPHTHTHTHTFLFLSPFHFPEYFFFSPGLSPTPSPIPFSHQKLMVPSNSFSSPSANFEITGKFFKISISFHFPNRHFSRVACHPSH